MTASKIDAMGPRAAQAANSTIILLVEDEPVVREVTCQVLEHAGYRVLASCGPQEALRTAQQHHGKIGLLLTDVVMPGMNGQELAHKLQSMQPNLVIVFMSGYASTDVAQEVSRSSAIHLQKPFTVDALLSRVAEALEQNAIPAPV